MAIAISWACTAEKKVYRTDFWLEAAADPVLQVEPASALPGDATLATLNLKGVVVNHGRLVAGAGDYALDLLVDDGQQGQAVTLRYNLGLGRRIPVERAALVQIKLWQVREPPAGPVRAMQVLALSSAALGRRQIPAVVVQANGLIPADALPVALRGIALHDEVAYQSADRPGGDCLRAAVHRQFLVSAAVSQKGLARAAVAHSPGSRLSLAAGPDRYDVLLGDNREILSSECANSVSQYFVWTAVWSPPPPGMRTGPEEVKAADLDVADSNVALSAGPTPVTATELPADAKGGVSTPKKK